MNAADPIAARLIAWTPFLAGGFLWNVAIALAALAIGTSCGALLARLRASPRRARARAGRAATALLRGIPTFVFQFYLAFVLPDTLTLPALGLQVPLPAWLKAALALSLAVAAFVSDSLARARRAAPAARRQALPALVSDWGSFSVTIVMASSTASVIGVPELVSRCNTLVALPGGNSVMLWVYLYAMAGFFLFCWSATAAIGALSRALGRRVLS
ncbi:ABC transporter permease subunit [Burkholderia sp. FERM BP-3421]|jgi:polar amino acid transport system permease protein|uniref:ABC transporter permease subunit n=1 Tax=Burkholderia sp. FERM BP-3421 TaxID=1494466 RepID=UPI00235E23C4|nr:ABC transporter permease subunit [Burkholderia sp. FERM BP-3421]WDD92615.1 ABC transporter permease subunit [Burkholderia sp. FERM BP-3421]